VDRSVIRTRHQGAMNLPLSPGIRAGSFVFVSGQVAIDPVTSEFVAGSTADQTHTVLKNLQAVLEAAGTSLDAVVKTTVYLTDLKDFPAFNDVYRKYFAADPPARSTVEVSRLVGQCKVEIDAIAIAPED
jgi:2-iminobutanoate/2-iminopropanoate deaminase